MYDKEARILIVGSGVFGLSAAYHLVQNGYKNIHIFDRNNYDETKYHPLLGSDSASGDINKFFRVYYETKSLYSKLAVEALDVWERWNEEIQQLPEADKARFVDDDLELIRLSGGLRISDTPEMAPVEKENLEGFERLGLRATQFDVNSDEDLLRAKLLGLHRKLAVVRDLQQRGKISTVSGTLDGIGRMLKADKACFYVKILLEHAGVKFYYGEQGAFRDKIPAGDAIGGITTADGQRHTADLVIVSAGPWTESLVPQLQQRIHASLANILYLEIPRTRQDLIDKYSEYPHFQWKTTSSEHDRNKNHDVGEGGFAFFPPTKKEGILKVNTRQRKYLNPERVGDRYVSVPKTLGDERLPMSVVEEAKEIFMAVAPDVVRLPGVKLKTKLLWYTDAINSDFVIDFVPGYQNLIVATGGSSHAFKFLPVLGKTVVDRVLGRENEYTELFRWKDPQDIKVDNYLLKEEHIERDEKRRFDTAVLCTDADLEFSTSDLERLDHVTI
ncbi:hypothetical protein KL949_004418 [Ogataea haglerorum]|nr:hypothetical protein KL913_004619 [Ogataea haglerorum]KAG7715025.1 hypothetical protein KL949_004418 [Ogataea haglerorum]KAG7755133.1 hypothetical protein KL947_004627 [Ogataea haglerorum]